MNNFIKLTDEHNGATFINAPLITTMTRHSDDTTWLRLMSGHVKVVKETPEEIIKMMEKTSYLTIKNIKNG